MKFAIWFLVFSIAMATVFAVEVLEVEEDAGLTVQDFLDYFEQENQMHEMEKRRPKIGPCRSPNGRKCKVCNLKITNKKDMRRYLVCGGGDTIV